MTIDRDFTPDPFDAEHCAVELQFHFENFFAKVLALFRSHMDYQARV